MLFLVQALAGVSAEDMIDGSGETESGGEDMGSGEVDDDNDEAEELPLPEEIISLLGWPYRPLKQLSFFCAKFSYA